MKKLLTFFIILFTVFTLACKKNGQAVNPATDTVKQVALANKPPAYWQEHWFEHNQLLSMVYYDKDLALYYDDDVPRSIIWPRKTFADAWAYIKKRYGNFGDSTKLYVIIHADKYGGGHATPFYDLSHDYRNVVDNGYDTYVWRNPTGDAVRLPIHEMGHIVASSSNGRTHDLQDGNIWGDSKFAEIFIYDVLMNIGYENEAKMVYDQMNDPSATNNFDYPGVSFPGVNFFVDWFYPIYSQYGKGEVLAKYFELIAKNVPMDRTDDLNLGEFVHFFSGAAGVNLRMQARTAFKAYWTPDVEQQFMQAQHDFPNVKYTY